jgi:hypothetical protein
MRNPGMCFVYLIQSEDGAWVLVNDKIHHDCPGSRVTFLASHPDETKALMLKEMFQQTVLPRLAWIDTGLEVDAGSPMV